MNAYQRCPLYRIPVQFFSFYIIFDFACETTWVGLGRDDPSIWATLEEWQEIVKGVAAHVAIDGAVFNFNFADVIISTVPR